MVTERFKGGDMGPVGKRFQRSGRMLPEGVVYHASWVDAPGARCFQVMEAENQSLIEVWAGRWSDLVEFEIVPVVTSSQFWSSRPAGPA
ncbi:MAG TPA: DUF3303 family protein [Candidatus Acidoferrales bacterium]